MFFASLKVKLPNMTDWHILPGLEIDVLIARCLLPVSPRKTECCSRYSASGHLQKFAADLSLSTPQNSQPFKIFTLLLNSNQNLCNIRLLQSHMRLKKNRPYNHWLKGQGHYLLCFSTSRTVGASSVRL